MPYRYKIALFSLILACTVSVTEPQQPRTYSMDLNESRNFSVWSTSPVEISVNFTPTDSGPTALRLKTRAYDSSQSLLMVARQENIVHTWQLPYIYTETDNMGREVSSHSYAVVHRTLCPPQLQANRSGTHHHHQQQQLFLQATTQSASALQFSVTPRIVDNFRLRLNISVSVQLWQSSPRLFYFDFQDYDESLKAVKVEALSEDSACGLLSLQTGSCPVQQTVPGLKKAGFRQTLQSSAIIFNRRDEFPSFLLVMQAYPSNRQCLTDRQIQAGKLANYTSKNVTITVEKLILHEDIAGATVAFGAVCLGVALVVAATSFLLLCVCRVGKLGQPEQGEQAPGGPEQAGRHQPEQGEQAPGGAENNAEKAGRHDGGHTLQLLAIVIFYGLPVIQMMLELQRVMDSRGNMDKCFYNFKCRLYMHRPPVTFYAFNNFISNAGYIAAGVAFMLAVCAKQYWLDKRQPRVPTIPHFYSAHYAAGLALIMEGVLSACYHLCPMTETFQYDTAFMVMLSGMMGLALYSKRHPNSNSLTNVAFIAFAVVVLVNTLGILASNFDVLNKVMEIGLGVLLLVPYFLGYKQQSERCLAVLYLLLNAGLGLFCIVHGALWTDVPFAYLVLVFVVSNTGLYFAYYLIRKTCVLRKETCCVPCVGRSIEHGDGAADSLVQSENPGVQVERQNAVARPGKIFKRRVFVVNSLLFISGCILFAFAMVYFLRPPTDWTASPAESRARNQNCTVDLLGLQFDGHDLWHLLGAGSFLCLLLFILFMDVDEEGKEHPEAF